MVLPNSYTIKTGAISDYFEAMLNAQAPDRFSHKFLEGLGFSSSNDRLLIGILKELGFLNSDGAPQQRYYEFLDRSVSQKVLADGIREAYQDLFAVNTKAYELSVDDAFNKLRTLYKGEKKDTVIRNIAKTFVALCDYADFTEAPKATPEPAKSDEPDKISPHVQKRPAGDSPSSNESPLPIKSLQYHINIVLPESRDQAVYDALFKSLRDHLG
ncbi:DUF5343 domain-containing protein [Aliiroseovarius sp. S2029]|uniref:DUF5343 domain-containing protein n=1 Tax=Aliiroseovarius sp. S2029 TaxID=2936988 RepID=UPI0020BFA80F|nr:DUF5343 domain-containing protein [Aliiroseovarius sp. S2029]MCK8485213.1 DUF5343 domain-containing protein [Aliiroseovarius sp. S2029]